MADKPTQKRVTFGQNKTHIISPREDETMTDTSSMDDNNTHPSADLSSLSAADLRILKSDRSESRIANEILANDKFNEIGETRENGNDGDPNAVRGEMTGTSVPSLSEFGHVVEAFNLSEERDTGLLRAARNTTIIGRGEDEDHEEDRWLQDNSIIDAKVLARMKAKEQDKEEHESARRKKPDRAWLQDVVDLLVSSDETVPAGLRRLRPSKKAKKSRGNTGGGGWRKTSQQQQQQQQQHNREQEQHNNSSSTLSATVAAKSFERLTEASSELMSRGYDEIYTDTRRQMLAALNNKRASAKDESIGAMAPASKKRRIDTASSSSTSSSSSTTTTTSCMWYYKRSLQDENAHGPFSSDHMRAWRQHGYFVGDNVVYLRRDPPYHAEDANLTGTASTGNDVDDLMNDLEDDLDSKKEDAAVWFTSEACTFD